MDRMKMTNPSTKDKPTRKLTPKQEKFIDEYMIDLNATQAAIRAGYSEKTAEAAGSRLLTNVKVQERINQLREQDSARLGVTRERVLEEYAKLAFSDTSMFFDEDGELLDIHKIPKEAMAAIGGIDVAKRVIKSGNKDGSDEETEYIKKIKIWDKTKALEALGRHLGLFEKDNKQKTDPISKFLQEIAQNTAPLVKNAD